MLVESQGCGKILIEGTVDGSLLGLPPNRAHGREKEEGEDRKGERKEEEDNWS